MALIRTTDMELTVVHYFNQRLHTIVPNVSWGIGMHECDLLILTKAGYAYEVEIKVSKGDLIQDKKKWHGHRDDRISRLYFAIPTNLLPYIEHIPARAGIIEVKQYGPYGSLLCKLHRKPATYRAYKFSIEDQFQIARLGTMRIWNLKQSIRNYQKERANENK